MRRLLVGSSAFLMLTGMVLVLPVYAAPAPAATPVEPSIAGVELGSVDRPRDDAVVTADGAVVDAGPDADVAEGAAVLPADPSPQDPVAASGEELDGVPALTVSRPDTEPFSAIGVTWSEDESVVGVQVQVRTKNAEGAWGEWQTLEQDDVELSEDGPSGAVRGGTDPLWTGPSRGVEVIVQAVDGSEPRDVQLELIDPGSSPADDVPGAPTITDTAHAAMTMPAIYSRAQWGADEGLMTWGPEYAPTLKAATIHHTADSNDYAAADVPAIMRSIYAYHAVSRAWGDIGYNVIVDKFGRAWEGRSGGLASTVIAAHAGGFNTSTFGISLLGNYELVTPSAAMIETAAAVAAWKLSLHGVDPKGTTVLTSSGGGTSKYPAGRAVTLPTIFGHRDVGATACPGKHVYSRLGDIRDLAAAKVASEGPAEAVAAPVPAQTMLRNDNVGGVAQWTTDRGVPGDVPLACDWDGSGNETIGLFRRGRFLLFDSNATAAPASADFFFGDPGDVPLCGDWDGDGKDTVGLWRKGVFFLKNSNTSGRADGSFGYGNVDAQPLVGNWDGDPFDTVAVFQAGAVYYTNSNLVPLAAGVTPFGDRTDVAVAGDWSGSGKDSIGVFRNGTFYFANSLIRTRGDLTVHFGDRGDRPLVADWDGNDTTTVGISRGY
ncbi:N-acetylmuramoyl-L-alanine amidase [Blastococcus sp. TF02A-30]|uniref:N-acetylmuramoyl-L-alanine amidase n=1 Tax=Blastococcus sp. TF02A-30 TaxID=2250580 RepID=UPI000DEAE28F|nr:N-acetylmuramoyl-L-alanine amidase [Blastococcus sp. TF02A-30]RBY86578.1 hypothetical protein DQ241_13820 [Blastococcus sp. TF02A-30]